MRDPDVQDANNNVVGEQRRRIAAPKTDCAGPSIDECHHECHWSRALFPLLDGMAQPRIPKKGLARMNRSTD
jgi:hypothetical protein